jgi:hypothetical protein
MFKAITLDESITILKRYVKYSEVKNQKHIDLSLCVASDRAISQEALMVVNLAVTKGEITDQELKIKLGLV